MNADSPRACPRSDRVDLLSRKRAALAFILVAAGSIVLALPRVLAGWPLWRDAVEYVAIAWNLVNGQGLVDPLMWTSYLADVHVPIPALAVRPVALPVLLTGPLALGANLTELRVAHIVWASLVGASGVWVARRAMTGAAAVAFAIAISWSYVWVLASQQLMSEATASGVVLLVIGLYRGFHASHARALTLAFVAFVGWLTRPNLAVLAPAVLIASGIELGCRRSLRTGPWWTFLLAFLALVAAAIASHWAATGLFPYAHYGVMFELDWEALRRYQWEYRGWRALAASAPQVAVAFESNVRMLAQEFFVDGAYLHLGWFAAPALVYSLLRHRRQPERIFAACAGLLLLASTLVVTIGFSSLRYPLPSAVGFWFLACASMGDLGQGLRDRSRAAPQPWIRRLGSGARALPLAVLLVLAGFDNWKGWLRAAPSDWRAYRRSVEHPVRSLADPWRALCGRVERDAVVASPDPWEFYLSCGNAGVKIPSDLQEPAWVERYLNAIPLGYVVLDDRPEFLALHASTRLRLVEAYGKNVLYEVKDPLPGSRPWTAPPPLADAGS